MNMERTWRQSEIGLPTFVLVPFHQFGGTPKYDVLDWRCEFTSWFELRHGVAFFSCQEPAMIVAIPAESWMLPPGTARKRMDPCGFASWEELQSKGVALRKERWIEEVWRFHIISPCLSSLGTLMVPKPVIKISKSKLRFRRSESDGAWWMAKTDNIQHPHGRWWCVILITCQHASYISYQCLSNIICFAKDSWSEQHWTNTNKQFKTEQRNNSNCRRKFRSETSDNMDRWKAEVRRVRREKIRRKKR